MGCVDQHPSGLPDRDLPYVSMQYFMLPSNTRLSRDGEGVWSDPSTRDKLLAFQRGWKACEDFYKVNR